MKVKVEVFSLFVTVNEQGYFKIWRSLVSSSVSEVSTLQDDGFHPFDK
jgi:hypothetical protein